MHKQQIKRRYVLLICNIFFPIQWHPFNLSLILTPSIQAKKHFLEYFFIHKVYLHINQHTHLLSLFKKKSSFNGGYTIFYECNQPTILFWRHLPLSEIYNGWELESKQNSHIKREPFLYIDPQITPIEEKSWNRHTSA